MTILAHKIKPILNLIPQALPMVKLASVDQEFPLDNRDSCLASFLQAEYMLKIAHEPVDPFILDDIAQACDVYDLTEQAQELSAAMVKKASVRKAALLREADTSESYMAKEALFENTLSGYIDFETVAKTACELKTLSKQAGVESSEAVNRYSANMYLDGAALQDSLANRQMRTQNEDFNKLASYLADKNVLNFDHDKVMALVSYVADMDKKAGLNYQGFNIYKEVLRTEDQIKTAMDILLCNNKVPYEKVAGLGHDRIASYIGKDVADELFEGGPVGFKNVAETLPRDIQNVLFNMSKNV